MSLAAGVTLVAHDAALAAGLCAHCIGAAGVADCISVAVAIFVAGYICVAVAITVPAATLSASTISTANISTGTISTRIVSAGGGQVQAVVKMATWIQITRWGRGASDASHHQQRQSAANQQKPPHNAYSFFGVRPHKSERPFPIKHPEKIMV